MDVKDFVKESLQQIALGVKEAQQANTGAVINPRIHASHRTNSEVLKGSARLIDSSDHLPIKRVDFDIAVTVVESGQMTGKLNAGIKVLGIGLEAGVSGSDESRNSSVSRLKFSVLMKLPLAKGQPDVPAQVQGMYQRAITGEEE